MPARVLVVDDNLDLAQNLRDVLEGARDLELDVRCAADGEAGLRAARDEGYDVAIVDVRLPDGSGVDLIRPLRAASPLGEVVLITGFATVDAAIAALRAGAFAFVLKSFRPEELISTVEQAVAKVELKREREELERRYRALVEAADVCIVGIDADGRVALANPLLCALAGVDADGLVGDAFVARLVPEGDRDRMQEATRAARERGRAAEVEAGLCHAGGAIRRVRWHLTGVRDARGRPDLVYGIGIDATERRALERRIASAEALSAMGSLALGLAHEIRNPLNAAVLQLNLIGRAADRLEDEAARASIRSRVGIVEAEIGRLGRLLGEFLDLARPREIRREPVDLGALAREVLDFQAGALQKVPIDVRADLDAECVVLGDREKLQQVLTNLVANALDAMPAAGTLSVRVGPRNASVVVEVGDTGPGIDPSVLPEVFDPFFTTKEAGTGLGLAIVRKIVDQHGGRIAIDSAPGEGTRVRVELPRAPGAPATGS